MSAHTGTASDPAETPGGVVHAVRPFYWSVRRELWENRALTRVPLAAAAVVLLGFLVSALHLPDRLRQIATDPAHAAHALAEPYHFTAILVMLLATIVGAFYCLDALHGERRDRSILFWKSLPVSDTIAVLAKVFIPLAVLPTIAFATILAAQIAMLLFSTLVALLHGLPVAALWSDVPLLPMSIELLYGLATLAIWYAPVYAWLLLVSSWARRTPLLWAVLPPLALCVLERLAFGTWHIGAALIQRLTGSFAAAFDFAAQTDGTEGHLSQLTPGRYFGTADVWIGIGIAAVLLAATIRLRRERGPI